MSCIRKTVVNGEFRLCPSLQIALRIESHYHMSGVASETKRCQLSLGYLAASSSMRLALLEVRVTLSISAIEKYSLMTMLGAQTREGVEALARLALQK